MLPKILVVDDCHSVRVSLKRILMNSGYDVIVAADGLEAIQKLEDKPALLVLDVNMPGLDGYGVCQKIRDLGAAWEHVPIVFLTSVESKALELLGQEFGAYLVKPVSKRDLITVIEDKLAEAVQCS